MRKEIDFDIIWKQHHLELSVEEQQELKQWSGEDIENQEFLRKANTFYSNPERKITIDESVALTKVYSLASKKIVLRRIMRIAAIFILPILIYPVWKVIRPSEETIQLAEINPLEYKLPTLMLSDRTKYELSDSGQRSFSEPDAAIIQKGSNLQYVSSKNAKHGAQKYNVLVVPRGKEYQIKLSDGSLVRMNAESSLKYPVTFSGDTREVEVTGEAYFDVTPDQEHPFIVNSGNQQIRVLGTSFNVSNYPAEGQIQTTLVHGRIQLSSSTNLVLSTILNPGEQYRYDKITCSGVKANVDVESYISWIDGKYIFEEERVDVILRKLAHWYDFDVQYQYPSLRWIHFSGSIKKSLDLKAVLAIIEKTNELKFELNGKKLIVRK